MYAAEKYNEGSSQRVLSTSSAAILSPAWLNVSPGDVASVSGRLHLLLDPTSTTDPPPTVSIGGSISANFPALQYSSGTAAETGTMVFLVTGLPPSERGTAFDLDVSFYRTQGTADAVFKIYVTLPYTSSTSVKIFEGEVTAPPTGSGTIKSARVCWVSCERPTFTVPPDSILQPGAQPVSVELKNVDALSDPVYIHSLRLLPL